MSQFSLERPGDHALVLRIMQPTGLYAPIFIPISWLLTALVDLNVLAIVGQVTEESGDAVVVMGAIDIGT